MTNSLQGVLEAWRRMGLVQRVMLISVLLACIGAGWLLVGWAREPHMALLYSRLDPEDAAEVVAQIQDADVAYPRDEDAARLLDRRQGDGLPARQPRFLGTGSEPADAPRCVHGHYLGDAQFGTPPDHLVEGPALEERLDDSKLDAALPLVGAHLDDGQRGLGVRGRFDTRDGLGALSVYQTDEVARTHAHDVDGVVTLGAVNDGRPTHERAGRHPECVQSPRAGVVEQTFRQLPTSSADAG